MAPTSVLMKIRRDLTGSVDEATKNGFQRFFKEQVTCYGVKSSTVGQIARNHWNSIQFMGKEEIFGLCEALFSSGYCEEAFIASNLTPRLSHSYTPSDLSIFKDWIDKYIDNWAKCDSFCNHTVGSLLKRFPDCSSSVVDWARSKNRWLRRASAVSFIVPARRGDFLAEVFAVADIMLVDPDDMVQKGYGWLLKEASRCHQGEVLDYVLRNRGAMPRTALRYAIELMPQELRARAMARD
ncbi:MAG: DNA alkylation repair protein [Candidatus Methanomethylicus sp.]|nr:DNA alkylation repair protein [Candidatus Methanomethylicus sp.]